MKVLIPNEVLFCVDKNAIVVYGILQLIFRQKVGDVIISADIVAQQLGYEIPLNKKKRETIRNTFAYLEELDYLKKQDRLYMFDTDNIYATNGYELCEEEVFRKLIHEPKLLMHYIIIKKGLIDGVCKFSLEYFAKKEEVSTSTIKKRNRDLVAMGLIKINTATFNPEFGKRHNNNIYTVLN